MVKEENKVKLAYMVDGESYVIPFNTKQAARVLDRFLRDEYAGMYTYVSKMIYDDGLDDGSLPSVNLSMEEGNE